MNLLISTYFDIEAYPPTLNAINCGADKFDDVNVLFRHQLIQNWPHKKNVTLYPSGNRISAREQENANIFVKIKFFLNFTTDYYAIFKKQTPTLIIVYDNIALLSHMLISILLIKKKTTVWYHNHDLTNHKQLRLFSIGWFAYQFEKIYFKHIDYFSVPSQKRLNYFKISTLKNPPMVIPNFPSLFYYKNFINNKKKKNNTIKLIYQGRISPDRGLQLIIPILNNKINGKQLTLTLKGFVDSYFRKQIDELCLKHNCEDKIEWQDATSYIEVPQKASECHIGLSILNNNDINKTTLGTASNKVYEYTALGLPVIYLNTKYNNDVYGDMEWAYPVEYNSASILKAISSIEVQYTELSAKALVAFKLSYNFEIAFNKSLSVVLNSFK